MRPVCLDCVRKHLGQAHVLLDEYATGDYDVHFWYAVGHMAEAESECIAGYPELAALIRAERIKMIENENYYTDFEPLIEMANKLAEGEINEEQTVDAQHISDERTYIGNDSFSETGLESDQ